MKTRFRSFSRAFNCPTFVLVIVAFATCAGVPATGATVGEALYAQAYMRSLQLMRQDSPPEIVKYQCGVFVDGDGNVFPRYCGRYAVNLSSADPSVRYGVPLTWVKGTIPGERGLSGLDSCQLSQIGLPVGYVQTQQDIADASRMTRDGVSVAFDDPNLRRCSITPPPPPGCELPKVCMVPPEPCFNCPVCPICPTCPPGLPPLSAAEQRAEELGTLLREPYLVFARHSYWRKKLPPWSEIWVASKPIVVELLLAKRRFELRVRDGQ